MLAGLVRAGAAALGLFAASAAADDGALVERGRYLVEGPAACGNCHTGAPNHRSVAPVFVAPDITSHADGLKGDTDAEIGRMIREGVRPDGSPMAPPVGYHSYARKTDRDLDAIVLYLQSLAPLPDGG